jgi:hypothetical protein
MDPKSQTSFIPGNTPGKVAGEASFIRRREGASKGMLYVVGSVLFVLSLVAAGAVFGYERYLNGRISNMQAVLESARESLDPELIKELSRSNARIMSAKEILSRHVAITTFFSLLQSLTLQSLRFTDFSFSSLGDRGIIVQMSGESRDYKTVALQSKIFSENPYIINPFFSDLTLNEEGNITFKFQARLVGDFLLYERGFEASPVNTSPQPPPVEEENPQSEENPI